MKFWIARAVIGLAALLAPACAGAAEAKSESPSFEEERHDSKGVVTVAGKRIEYDAVAGTIMIEANNSEPGALMSYVA